MTVSDEVLSLEKRYALSPSSVPMLVMVSSPSYWSLILHLQIQLKLDKSKEDKAAENKRNELLKFLNASYD